MEPEKKSAYKCPLCKEGDIEHKQWMSTHLYICDACPYLAMEWHKDQNTLELIDYLKHN